MADTQNEGIRKTLQWSYNMISWYSGAIKPSLLRFESVGNILVRWMEMWTPYLTDPFVLTSGLQEIREREHRVKQCHEWHHQTNPEHGHVMGQLSWPLHNVMIEGTQKMQNQMPDMNLGCIHVSEKLS